jgi:hypothetical protein
MEYSTMSQNIFHMANECMKNIPWHGMKYFWKLIPIHVSMFDVPLNSSIDPKVGPRTKQRKKKKVGARSLIYNTSEVGGHAKALRWD